jgi:nicotinamidase-related amidase
MKLVSQSSYWYQRQLLFLLATTTVFMSLFSPSLAKAQGTSESKEVLKIKPRYYRWHVNPGTEWVETNTDHANLDWSIPLEQTALVLVDVWDRHYLKDTEARAEVVIDESLVPLLAQCRQAGMTVIHAPAPQHAKKHPNWVGVEKETLTKKRVDWPPPNFRSKSGQFKQYSRPAEPRAAELARLRANLTIHPQALPFEDEPVVATGEELHQVCKQSGILFLFYVGFNTNACILTRDYGTVAMSRRGYEIILVRDCTTGMESCQSQATMGQTKGAVLFLEMFGQYSVTSQELRASLKGL